MKIYQALEKELRDAEAAHESWLIERDDDYREARKDLDAAEAADPSKKRK